MFYKVSENHLKFHHIIPIGNDFQTSPTISIKFVEKFSLISTKLFKITKKFLEFSNDILKFSPKI